MSLAKKKSLRLSKETLRSLSPGELGAARGAGSETMSIVADGDSGWCAPPKTEGCSNFCTREQCLVLPDVSIRINPVLRGR